MEERNITIQELQQQLQERNTVLEKIHNIAEAINSENDLAALVKTILRESCYIVKGVDQTFALIYDTSLNAYTYKAGIGLDLNALEQACISFEEMEERYVSSSKEICEDVFIAGKMWGKDGQDPLHHPKSPEATLIFRIPGENHVEGYIIFENMSNEHAFDEQETQLLKNLETHIISAVIKTRLLEESQIILRKLEESSLTDPLTGMRNRKYLAKYIHNDIAEVHRSYHRAFMGKAGDRPEESDILFFILGVDHFKTVNEMYGHEASDQILIQVRELLERVCRESDILVRWSGAAFLAISRYANQDHAHVIAERLRTCFEKHTFEIGDTQTIHLTCSIGSASYPFFPTYPDYLNWEQVVAVAEKGFRAAKLSGHNAYVNIMSTKTTTPNQLFQRIQQDIESLIQTGELQMMTSLPDPETLVFYKDS